MRFLEIVHLRSAGDSVERVSDAVKESTRSALLSRQELTVFRRNGLETDIAVHIDSGDVSGPATPSDLGLRLASELRSYGLVEHTVWRELS
jgi:hypothetical protein